jgi:aldose 1-epimerase
MPSAGDPGSGVPGTLSLTSPAASLSIAPSAGNVVYEMRVKGEPILHFPCASIDEYRDGGKLGGIPLLAPWANRLGEMAFYANGRRYAFDPELGNVHGPIPIHGLLARAGGWRIVGQGMSPAGSWVTNRLEFHRRPEWIKQFPFAHAFEITHRLEGADLQVETTIENLSDDPMPVSIGFHPYLTIADTPRDDWTISIGARTHWRLDDRKIPTGETEPIGRLFSDAQAIPLRDYDLDHVFSDLIPDADGCAVCSVRGRRRQIDVVFGPNYRAAVVYAPRTSPASPFVCFEPMAAITDAMNLAHRGQYGELQTIGPGGRWTESFWIRTRDVQ